MNAIVIKKVNARLDANTGGKKVAIREAGEQVQIVGVKNGESYQGSDLWYVDAQNFHYTSHALQISKNNNRLSSLVDFSALWNNIGSSKIKIGIYDCGVSKNESLFQNRVVQMNHDNASIVNHHADYMATIIAGGDFNNGYIGFLPAATIYSYQAPKVNNDNEITLADLKEGIKRMLDQKVDLINVSMRTTTENDAFAQDQEIADLLAICTQRGVPVIAAVGNENRRLDKFGTYPAKLDKVYAVSGYLLLDQDNIGFDTECNLWTGVDLLTTSEPIFPDDFFDKIKLAATAGSSVSAAVSSGVIGALKIKAKQIANTLPLDYIDSELKRLPDWINDEFPKVAAKSFKLLDFSILKNLKT